MEVFTLLIFIVIIYLLYILINTISSLRDEVHEMKDKCIAKKQPLKESKTADIKKDIKDKYNFFTNLIKKMI